MVRNFPGTVRLLLAIAFVMVLRISLFAQEQQHQTPATVSPPSNQETNSGKSLESRRLKDLEQSIFSPLKAFTPESSLDGVLDMGSQRSPAPSKREKRRARLGRGMAGLVA